MKQIKLDYAELYYEAPIIYIVFNEDVELGFPEIRELTQIAQKISDNEPYLVLSDVRKHVNVTPEGKKISVDGAQAPLLRGSAILVNSTLLSAAANFFNKFNPPSYPYQVFSDKEKAKQWLLQLPLGK
jgi:hypothetical protein